MAILLNLVKSHYSQHLAYPALQSLSEIACIALECVVVEFAYQHFLG